MIETLLTTTASTIDVVKMKSDDEILEEISTKFPKDSLVDIGELEYMATITMYGISICDYWVPILMVVVGELESAKNKAKNKAYINAGKDSDNEGESTNKTKLTAELRKAYSEIDPDYLRISSELEKIKAIKKYFEDKRESFKTFHFFMKEQQKHYIANGGREVSGESLSLGNSNKTQKKYKPKYNSEEEYKPKYNSEEEF